MKKANFVNSFQRVDDFKRRSSQFLLCKQRDVIGYHVGGEVLLRPFHDHINVLLILEVFHVCNYVFLSLLLLFHYIVEDYLRDVLGRLLVFRFKYDFDGNFHSCSNMMSPDYQLII